MKIQKYFLSIFLLLNTLNAFSQTEKAYINDSWKFIKEDNLLAANVDFDDKVWQKVNLPHTWNSIDAYTSKQYFNVLVKRLNCDCNHSFKSHLSDTIIC